MHEARQVEVRGETVAVAEKGNQWQSEGRLVEHGGGEIPLARLLLGHPGEEGRSDRRKHDLWVRKMVLGFFH